MMSHASGREKLSNVRELAIGLHIMKVTGDLGKGNFSRLVVEEAPVEWVVKTMSNGNDGN